MVLQVDNLGVCYGRRPAVEGISFSLSAGEVVMLLGPNGSGKSTLLSALLGQLPSTGSVRWCGKLTSEWTLPELARQVAYLAQVPAWESGQTVAETLSLGRLPYLRLFGMESARDAQVIADVARQLELEELLDRPLGSLSGGQRQRVLVGRGLVQEPKVLLLDEPNTHLDLKHQVELGELLVKLTRGKQLAVLMTSHDLNLAGAFADRLLLLDQGRLVAAGTGDEVLQPSVLEPVYGVSIRRVESGPDQTPLVGPVVTRRQNGLNR